MRQGIALQRFRAMATEFARELEAALKARDTSYTNAEIALSNVHEWLNHASAGTSGGAYLPSFGLSKADLMLGPVEGRMY